MTRRKKIRLLLLIIFSLSYLTQAEGFIPSGIIRVHAAANTVTASDLISLINGLRTANGLGALSVDSSLMACAQSTANTMAQNSMSWHIGDVSGRVSTYGYNNGNKAFATENFMIGPMSLSTIQSGWSDADHMIPANNPSYCHIGAGVSAEVNGQVYYVIQAAYPANKSGCGFSPASADSSYIVSSGSSSNSAGVSQIIASIKIATPDSSGTIYHTVENGQSLWSIATAYDVSVEDIKAWNNIIDTTSLSLEQKLLIPKGDAVLVTPTPLVPILPTMNANKEFRHEIIEGDTLYSIAKLWKTTVDELLRWNGLTEDSTIGLGWKLLIPITPTVTSAATQTMTPSQTSPPTETPLPSETPTLTPAPTEKTKSHRPQASVKTYIVLGLAGLILAGGGLICAGLFYRKKL